MQKKHGASMSRLLGAATIALTATQMLAGSARAESGKEWAAYGGDWANTRYSTLNSINTNKAQSNWIMSMRRSSSEYTNFLSL